MKAVPGLGQWPWKVALSRCLLSPLRQLCPRKRNCTAALEERVEQQQICEHNLPIREPYLILHHWLAVAQKNAPKSKPRIACLATVDTAGQPVTRLTNVEQINAAGITFYTALGSRQAGEISTNPHVSLQFHWPLLDRSVRIAGIASPVCALQAQRQFARYSREVQLSMHGIQQGTRRSTKNWLVRGIVQERIMQFFNRLMGNQLRRVPVPHNFGGILLKPTLYEFFDASCEAPATQCMRFRRCLTLPRGTRNRTFKADRYDWVFDNTFEHDA